MNLRFASPAASGSCAPQARLLALVLALGACAAPNPAPTPLSEGPPDSPPDSPSGAPTGEAPDERREAASTGASAEPAAAPDRETAPVGPDAGPDDRVRLPVARVGGTDVDVRNLLVRSWWRSSIELREMLEQLVVERLAMLEGQRLGVHMQPEEVEDRVDGAYLALGERVRESGREITVEAWIREVIGLDPEFYEEQLRGDAIVQILLERSIRAWTLEHERIGARFLAVADRENLQAAQDLLESGASFGDVSDRYSIDEMKAQGGTPVTIVQDERIPLSRVAFQTPVGEIGGPIEESGRFLLLLVEARLEPWSGPTDLFHSAVRESVAENPIEDLEYVQWRTAMGRRYEIDLSPFAELVERPGR